MDANDIPTSITQLVDTAPTIGGPTAGVRSLSWDDTRDLLAHYWPSIEKHIRQAVSEEFTERGKSQGSFSWGEAALIARGEL